MTKSELEAEVEWLRAQIEGAGPHVQALIRTLGAYRAAVAEVRTLLARGPKYWAHVDEFVAILDKLPHV